MMVFHNGLRKQLLIADRSLYNVLLSKEISCSSPHPGYPDSDIFG